MNLSRRFSVNSLTSSLFILGFLERLLGVSGEYERELRFLLQVESVIFKGFSGFKDEVYGEFWLFGSEFSGLLHGFGFRDPGLYT